MQVSPVRSNESYKEYCLLQITSITVNVVTSAAFFALYELKKNSTSNSNLKFKTWHFVVVQILARKLLPTGPIVPFRSSDFGFGSLVCTISTSILCVLNFSGVVVRVFSESLAAKKILLEPLINAKIPCLSFLARKLLFKDRTIFVIAAIGTTLLLVLVNWASRAKQRAEDQQFSFRFYIGKER